MTCNFTCILKHDDGIPLYAQTSYIIIASWFLAKLYEDKDARLRFKRAPSFRYGVQGLPNCYDNPLPIQSMGIWYIYLYLVDVYGKCR